MPTTPPLAGPRVQLRPFETADLAALLRIRAEPGVQRWWGAPRSDDFDAIEDGDLLVIAVDGELAGSLQYRRRPNRSTAMRRSTSTWAPRGRGGASGVRRSRCSSATSSRRAATTA